MIDALAGGLHRRAHARARPVVAREAHGNAALPLFGAHVLDERRRPGDACVVHEDVEAAQALEHPVDPAVERRDVGDVDLGGDEPLGTGGRHGVRVDVAHMHLGALRRERPRDREADPARRCRYRDPCCHRGIISGATSYACGALYSSSVTCSPQAAALPASSTSSMARCVMKRVGRRHASAPHPARRTPGRRGGSPRPGLPGAGRARRPRPPRSSGRSDGCAMPSARPG